MYHSYLAFLSLAWLADDRSYSTFHDLLKPLLDEHPKKGKHGELNNCFSHSKFMSISRHSFKYLLTPPYVVTTSFIYNIYEEQLK